jgi:hypothetical protein
VPWEQCKEGLTDPFHTATPPLAARATKKDGLPTQPLVANVCYRQLHGRAVSGAALQLGNTRPSLPPIQLPPRHPLADKGPIPRWAGGLPGTLEHVFRSLLAEQTMEASVYPRLILRKGRRSKTGARRARQVTQVPAGLPGQLPPSPIRSGRQAHGKKSNPYTKATPGLGSLH